MHLFYSSLWPGNTQKLKQILSKGEQYVIVFVCRVGGLLSEFSEPTIQCQFMICINLFVSKILLRFGCAICAY